MNNGKKYLLIASGILLTLLVGVFILQRLLSGGGGNSSMSPTPTLNPYSYTNRSGQNNNKVSGGGGSTSSAQAALAKEQKARSQMEQVKRSLPLENDDYKVEYSPNLDKIVLTRKSGNADQAFNDWLNEHGYPLVVNNPGTIIYSDKSMEEVQTPFVSQPPRQRLDAAINLMSVLLYPSPLPTVRITLTPTPVPNSSSSKKSTSSSPYTPKEYGGYVYYSQCHGPYDNYPLTATCTVCQAGCGPTTVAMILSSYVDKKYDPPEVVDIYKSIGAAACGTGLGYAKSVLSSHGVTTSDYIIPYTGAEHDIKEVQDDLQAYLDNGWTIFVLAWYRPNQGGGHYFWLTDIDENGNALAFDPYYGMDQSPPINENVRYPMPKYAAAFGVKRK